MDRRRFTGLVIGFEGVIALLGLDFHGSASEFLGAGAVLLSALGYAGAALLYRRWLADARIGHHLCDAGGRPAAGRGLAGEKLTIGAIAGLILIAFGAWLATGRRRRARPTERSRTQTTSAGQRLSPAATGRSSGTDSHCG